MVSTDNKLIEEIFYKQVKDLTQRNKITTLDSFNYQFSGRCFL